MIYCRKMKPGEGDALHALWERSVRATHTFLSEEDIAFFSPMVRDVFTADLTIWVAFAENDLAGFMALDVAASPVKLEALFIDPVHFRKGVGSCLVAEAIDSHAPLDLDVNEQNPGAREFYRRMGFTETGRSPLDGAGKPFPLIHMRYPA